MKYFILIISLLSSNVIYAQHYGESQQKKVESDSKLKKDVAVDKNKKVESLPKDSMSLYKKYLSTGYTLSAHLGLNKSHGSILDDGPYLNFYFTDDFSVWEYADVSYLLDSKLSYTFGLSQGFHSKDFGVEFPILINKYRFAYLNDENDIEKFSINTFNFSTLCFIKLPNEKASLIFGPGFSLSSNRMINLKERKVSYNLNFGLRFKLAPKSSLSLISTLYGRSTNYRIEGTIVDGRYDTPVDKYFSPGSIFSITYSYDIVNTRKTKYQKIEQPKPIEQTKKVENNKVNNSNNTINVEGNIANNNAIDYSKLSISELKDNLKTASNNNELEKVIIIQKEIDLREKMISIKGKSILELNEMLKKALQEEKYKEAEFLQNEITKLQKQEEFKGKTIEELKNLLNEAISKEDFRRAELIQKEIDSKK